MGRLRELSYRVGTTCLVGALAWLSRKSDTTYKVGPNGAASLFEGCWFRYNLAEFGSTGNIDFDQQAENETRQFLFTKVENGQTFFDIGAHGGVYTLTLKKRFPKLNIHSFEPQPEELLFNLALNGVSARNVHPVALGDKAGTVRMTTKERSSNHISERGDREVPMVRIDDLELPDADWIKIDIEGMELPALKGAEKLLRRAKPTIVCEINHISGRYGTKASDLIEYLGRLGYRPHTLRNGKLEAFEGELPPSADNNYWFLPNK